MNYLAHIYLSGNDDDLKIGNFIADSVKGKNYLKYRKGIENGIVLHRKIDSYTDAHPIVRQSISRLAPNFGLYGGVIIDILYDHFLAANWNAYHSLSLEDYVAEFYVLLNKNFDVLPRKVQNFLPIMEQQNWLVSYSTVPGIEKILFQMNQRIKNRVQLHLAIRELEQYYDEFAEEFKLFFEELQKYVLEQREIL